MKNNCQKYHIIKSFSKHINDKNRNSKKKINNTIMTNHSKKKSIINIKRMLINRTSLNSKFKTSKNSCKYIE